MPHMSCLEIDYIKSFKEIEISISFSRGKSLMVIERYIQKNKIKNK